MNQTLDTMNEPTPAAPFAPTPMTIEQVTALAQQLCPVPVGALIISQQLQTSFEAKRSNVVRWSISHFPPNSCTLCTMAEATTPLEAITNLIKQLTPCDTSTASA